MTRFDRSPPPFFDVDPDDIAITASDESSAAVISLTSADYSSARCSNY